MKELDKEQLALFKIIEKNMNNANNNYFSGFTSQEKKAAQSLLLSIFNQKDNFTCSRCCLRELKKLYNYYEEYKRLYII